MSSLKLEKIRVRFAPSPTGYLHVGGLRTALFNYLFAKHSNGTFILRIEDTDQSRYIEGATENLIEMLQWAGINADEGPHIGGEYGPYCQSQRRDIYKKYVEQLIANGHAYYAFDTPEQLQQMRKAQRDRGDSDQRYERMNMLNSLTLEEDVVQQKLNTVESYVVRLLVPEDRDIEFQDIVRGHVSINSREVDDQILLKSDGYPTYHLANVVDDHLMEITHVIRGEEWLSSVPKHVLLYSYLGWEMPQLAHLPLIFNPDGTKMSKRDSGKNIPDGRRFDPDVDTYRKGGYLKDAVINYIALLGWNPGEGDERQIFSQEELIKEFTLERVNKARAIFDITKLKWINGQHIKERTNQDICSLIKPVLERQDISVDDDYLSSVINLMKERVQVIDDFVTSGMYFFRDPEDYEEKGVKKNWKEQTSRLLSEFVEAMENLTPFTQESIEQVARELVEKHEIGGGKIIHPTRLAVSGVSVGPSLFELLEVLGKETVVRRIRRACKVLG